MRGRSATTRAKAPSKNSLVWAAGIFVGLSLGVCVPAQADSQLFVRADTDANGRIELTDAVVTLGYLFLGNSGPGCLDRADSNDDGSVDIADPILTLNFLFLGGASPSAPFPEAGIDPTDDTLACGDCGRPAPAPDIAFCGTEALICAQLRSDVIDSERVHRNGSPSIAVDSDGVPHIVYSRAVNGFQGHYAILDDGSWLAGQMIDADSGEVISAARLDIRIGADDQPFVLADDGGFGTFLWAKEGLVWERIEQVVGASSICENSFEVDSNGCAYAALTPRSDEESAVAIGTRSDAWNVQSIGLPGWAEFPVLALQPNGTPWVAYWEALEGWQLRFASPADGPETVAPLRSSGLSRAPIQFAYGGEPHFLVSRPNETSPGLFDLDYITRGSKGEWVVTTLGSDEGDPDTCNRNFPEEGATCSYRYSTYYPHGIFLNRRGDVRFLVSKVDASAELVAVCDGFPKPPLGPDAAPPPPPPPECFWEGEEVRETELLLLWVDDGKVISTSLTEDFDARGAHAVIDAQGTVHVASYGLLDSGLDVSYRSFTAGDQ
ncbi:MAG: hypothetical protein AAF517_02240 [Planctomycetota bacterium]